MQVRPESGGVRRIHIVKQDEEPRWQPDAAADLQEEQPSELPMPTSLSSKKKALVVCVGASAGGLVAYKELLLGLPVAAGISYVLVPHLAPGRESLMTLLLSRFTVLPVTEIEDGIEAKPDHIYVIPPNKYASIQHGMLHLSPLIDRPGARTALDRFLISLAEDQHENTVGIILSGTGSYGTPGLKFVRENGGTIFAQEPHTAKFPSMPESAIATGLVDRILSPGAMGPVLLRLSRMHSTHPIGVSAEELEPEILGRILAVLLERTGLDFRGYRRNMLTRRIIRRMQLAHIDQTERYAVLLREEPMESERLAKDIMVSVTKFFREPDGAFEDLRRHAIPEIVKTIGEGESIRCWIAGCATGEEAYSIAILFLEHYSTTEQPCPLTIFASDVDEAALSFARLGVYPDSSLAGMTPERRHRFFVRVDEHSYRIHPKVRELVTFAAHSVVSDPPFSSANLISCRNVLIYLEPELQGRVMAQLHFALKDSGFLILGPAEGVSGHSALFSPMAQGGFLYRPIGDAEKEPSVAAAPARMFSARQLRGQRTRAKALSRPKEVTYRLLAKRYGPAAVLTDSQGEILQYHGPTELYLNLPSGEPNQNVLSMARAGLRQQLRVAMKQVMAQQSPVTVEANLLRGDDYLRIRLSVDLEEGADPADPFLLITFEQPATPHAPSLSWEVKSLIRQLETDLRGTREELEETIETIHTTVADLECSTQEAMSMNEELQSANEELESSKEEMHSLNEELLSANSQLQSKLKQLEVLNDDMANLIRSTDLATLCLDTELRVQWFTPGVTALLHLLPTDVNRPVADIALQAIDPTLVEDALLVLRSSTPLKKGLTPADGQFWARQIVPYLAKTGTVKGVVITFINVTEVQLAEQGNRRLTAVLLDSSDAIISFDFTGQITAWNRGAERMYGYTEGEALRLNVTTITPEGRRPTELRILSMARNGNLTTPREAARVCKDGNLRESWVTTTTLLDQNGLPHSVAVTERDLTDSKAVSRIQHLATHDQLTGLPNRLLLDPLSTQAFAFADRNKSKVALLFLDTDGFKIINDSRGHQFGDSVLVHIAKCLKNCVRGQDAVVRHGGDEFIVMLSGLKSGKAAGKAAEHILSLIARPYTIQSEQAHSSATIGISLYPDDGGDLETLIRKADVAMYQAKARGPNTYRFFSPDMRVDLWDRQSLEYGLTRALERHEFILEYQPIVEIPSGAIVGAEALVRWQHPELGLLKPANFISAAEDSGLIVALGEWVLTTACAQLESWKQAGLPALRLSINISAVQIAQFDFPVTVARVLEEYKTDPRQLEFEITESALIRNIEVGIVRLQQLRRLGIGLALDDFGTGYSSLSYLRQLPIDRIKMDVSFVRALTHDEGGDIMVKAIVSMAKSLNIKVLAEGVESREQLRLLHLEGCDQMQGFYFSPAVPAQDFESILRRSFQI